MSLFWQMVFNDPFPKMFHNVPNSCKGNNHIFCTWFSAQFQRKCNIVLIWSCIIWTSGASFILCMSRSVHCYILLLLSLWRQKVLLLKKLPMPFYMTPASTSQLIWLNAELVLEKQWQHHQYHKLMLPLSSSKFGAQSAYVASAKLIICQVQLTSSGLLKQLTCLQPANRKEMQQHWLYSQAVAVWCTACDRKPHFVPVTRYLLTLASYNARELVELEAKHENYRKKQLMQLEKKQRRTWQKNGKNCSLLRKAWRQKTDRTACKRKVDLFSTHRSKEQVEESSSN